MTEARTTKSTCRGTLSLAERKEQFFTKPVSAGLARASLRVISKRALQMRVAVASESLAIASRCKSCTLRETRRYLKFMGADET